MTDNRFAPYEIDYKDSYDSVYYIHLLNERHSIYVSSYERIYFGRTAYVWELAAYSRSGAIVDGTCFETFKCLYSYMKRKKYI